jgi:hypothetical protein
MNDTARGPAHTARKPRTRARLRVEAKEAAFALALLAPSIACSTFVFFRW